MSSDQLESKRSAEITAVAIRYLSNRDYSRWELRSKLLVKSFAPEDVDIVLDNLEEKGYQSDERFVEMFLRSRISRGDGPFKIKMELGQKGVAKAVITQLFDSIDIDWLAQAHKVRQKHFGDQLPADSKGLSKQMRYLRNKGFYQDHIDTVLSVDNDILK